ncbi:MAG: Yip1 family protein [Phycisphaerales bacterium]|nr:Yip1 family protein [Phycisphaerales bacterium]
MNENQEPQQWGDIHYDADAGQWKAPDEGQFGEEAIAADKGSVSFLGLPWAFFFKPSQFMRSFAVHIPGWLLFLIIWMAGASQVAATFENRLSLGKEMPLSPNNWVEFWIIVVIAGIIRGAIAFGLGTWWYGLRLSMCNVQNREWDIKSRVYMSAGIMKHTLVLLIFGVASLKFDSLSGYVQDSSTFEALSFAGLVIALEIWSSFTLYFGTRAVFPVKKIWAIVWFLVLPIILRIIGIAFLIGMILFSGFAAEPATDQPSRYRGESFVFNYPSNWFINNDEEVPGPESWVEIEPIVGDAYFELAVRNIDTDEDLIEDTRSFYENDVGLVFEKNPKQLSMQGGFEGRGFEYQVELKGSEFLMRLFECQIEGNTHLLVIALVDVRSWEVLKPGYQQIISSLQVTKPSEIITNIESTYTVRKDVVEYEIPQNWWLDIYEEEDSTNEDGSISKGDISIIVQTPGWGYFRVMLYESTLSPRAELGLTIDSYSDDSRLINEQPLEEWLGLTGFGAQGQVSYDDGTLGEAKFMISELPDGRLIEVREVVPTEVVDFYSSGFELIKSTFQVR